jgi:serine phosphatase RsbU (regulator of sigma subunit)
MAGLISLSLTIAKAGYATSGNEPKTWRPAEHCAGPGIEPGLGEIVRLHNWKFMNAAAPQIDDPAEKGRILVVDDDPQICSVFRKVLERSGHVVMEATGARQGLALVEHDSPELVLLDLKMPDMGGLQMLDKISQLSPGLPVIIISGSGEMNDAIQALRLGACDYLVKPLPDSSVLIHAVAANLQRARLIRENQKYVRELARQHAAIQADEEAGRKIQAKLFPPPDWRLGDYRFQHRMIPSLSLSGDCLDYFSVDANHAVFYCVDVSGHGVSSALVTVLVKSLMKKYREFYHPHRRDLILEPDRLLAQLNQDLLHEDLGKHLTAFYGVLNLDENSLCFACGGQFPPPILFSAAGARRLEAKSMAVGLFPDATFVAEKIALPAAFRFLLVSDGALDVLPMPTVAGKLAYLQTLQNEARLNQFIEQMAALEHLPDDLTILSITREKTL